MKFFLICGNTQPMNVREGENFSLALAGVGIGFINGFLGGGGGILVVFALLSILRYDPQRSHATALWIILPVTIVSAVVYIISGAIDWYATAITTIGVVVGGIFGAQLLNKLNPQIVRLIFCIELLVAGVRMFM